MITTIDGAIAGAQPPQSFIKTTGTMEAIGVYHSLYYAAGRPGASAAPSSGLSGAALTSTDGQIPYANPGGGSSAYLHRFRGKAGLAGALSLMDRLWENSGIVVTTTGAQTINSVAWPARDRAGSVNGDDVLVALEVSATMGNGVVTTITMSYTNSAGVAGRTATIPSFNASALQGTFIPFMLQAGDTGVRSIQSITLGTTLVSGIIHLVAYRVLAEGDVSGPAIGFANDPVSGGFVLLHNDTVPFLVWLPTATTTTTVSGSVQVTHG